MIKEPKEETKMVGVHMPKDHWKKISNIAERESNKTEQNVTCSDVIRYAVKLYLDSEVADAD